MSLAVVKTRAKLGIQAPQVDVEVHLSNGLPAFHIVGLPETAVKESKDRVRSALINLAPAELPKGGSRFGLAIAIGILQASGQIPDNITNSCEFIGELALSGEIRPVDAVLPAALACRKASRNLILGSNNAREAALAEGLVVLPAEHLLQVSAHLHERQPLDLWQDQTALNTHSSPQLSDVIGQHQAKRALMIAAVGGHNLLFSGPPGSGKSMLASRLPGILPPLSNKEALEVAAIHSVAGKGLPEDIYRRPFRAPHHTASAAALVGGGSSPRPGEISLAHRGVLFLDELPEFSRPVLEVLREPMESGQIMISRIAAQTEYPADFQLVGAMNPCPCGYSGSSRCQCTPDQISRYRGKISGPLLDRIDLQVWVGAIDKKLLMDGNSDKTGDSNQLIQQRVTAARARQLDRQGKTNNALETKELQRVCPLDGKTKNLLDQAMNHFTLSARSYHRLLRVARSIADLDEQEFPGVGHYQEALSYRFSR